MRYLSSNTSGIPLHQMAEGRSESFRRRFLGTHFFNPPRYLKLMEIIPTEETDPEIVEAVRDFGERVLGKGGVIAKDTPNFIGNRLGSFAGMQSARYAFENGYGIEEVDAITGPLIGHPKTATFRLNDQVGLDIAVGVAENLYEAVPEDESREDLKPPEKLKEMQEKTCSATRPALASTSATSAKARPSSTCWIWRPSSTARRRTPRSRSSKRRSGRATRGRGCGS